MSAFIFTPENINAAVAAHAECDRKEADRKKKQEAKIQELRYQRQLEDYEYRQRMRKVGRFFTGCLAVLAGIFLFAVTLGFVGVMGGASDGTWGRRR